MEVKLGTFFAFGCGSLNHKTFDIAFLIGANWWAAGGLSPGTPPSKRRISTNIKMYAACPFSLIFNNKQHSTVYMYLSAVPCPSKILGVMTINASTCVFY